jgi:hypothetical protein
MEFLFRLIGLIFLFFGFHHTCHAKSPNSSNERKRKKKRFWGNFLQKAKNISRQNAKRKKKEEKRTRVGCGRRRRVIKFSLLTSSFFSFFPFWLLASFDCYYYDSKGYITTGPANTHTHTHTADDDVTGLTSMPGAAWRIFWNVPLNANQLG